MSGQTSSFTDDDLRAFESGARAALRQFSDPKPAPRKATRIEITKGLEVTLGVQKKRIGMPEAFVFQSSSLSSLVAIQEAKAAARAAGFPIFCFVIDKRVPDARTSS